MPMAVVSACNTILLGTENYCSLFWCEFQEWRMLPFVA